MRFVKLALLQATVVCGVFSCVNIQRFMYPSPEMSMEVDLTVGLL